MASKVLLSNVDPATAADMRSQGRDSHEEEQDMEPLMKFIYSSLPYPLNSFLPESDPEPPESEVGHLTSLCAAPSDGIDRISRLPDALLRDIVSRLPAKDAARTAVLATRWREVWLSAPLSLLDFILYGCDERPPALASKPGITGAVSRVLAAHPGPFRAVHLISAFMGAHPRELERWLHLLVAKGIQELVLVNCPWPCGVPLPKTLFRIDTLTRLYIGFWTFPDASSLRGACFPNLRELGLCGVFVEHGNVDSVVARSPVLETLNICSTSESTAGLHLRLISQSLRCVQICASLMENITVVNTPCLERLILWGLEDPIARLCTKVNIGNAPKLRLLGYLDPGKHILQIGDTIVRDGFKATASTLVTSVKILTLKVRFGVRDDVKMVPTFLQCFPNVEALHIMSAKCDQCTGSRKLNLSLSEEACRRIKVMTLRDFRGGRNEVAFLRFFFQSALELKHAPITMADPTFTLLSPDKMFATVQKMSDEK